MNIEEKLNEAIKYQQTGKVEKAIRIYKQVLKVDPKDVDALYYYGIAEYQLGNVESSLNLLNKALKIHPHFQIYKFLGEIHYDLGLLDKAIEFFNEAISLNAEDFNIYYNLGVIYHKQKKYSDALDNYKKTITMNPQFVKGYNNLATLLLELKRPEEAIVCCKDAIAIVPDDANLYFNLGHIYKLIDDVDNSIKNFKKAVEFNSQDYVSLANLGVLYGLKDDTKHELECYKKAIEINPDYYELQFNLGNLYHADCDYEKSLEHFNKALSLKPEDYQLYSNLASVYIDSAQPQKAIDICEKGLKIKPDDENLSFNLFKAKLFVGNINEGWEYFNNMRLMNESKGGYSYLLDYKGSLENEEILVYWDLGLGDTIQFGRYVQLLSEKGARVLFKPQKTLEKLFKDSDFKAHIVPDELAFSQIEFSYQINVSSLCYLFKTDLDKIPLKSGYLKADINKAKAYKQKYFDNDKFKVGIVWDASDMTPKHVKKSVRDIKEFLPLLNIENIKVYSLQKGEAESQLKALPEGVEVIELGSGFNDFSDTAAVIENLDLLISVDTSVAHLGGAMAKATWVLLPTCSDWRWFTDVDYSAWYDSVKLFRQKNNDDWSEVIENVVSDLKQLI